MTTTLTREAVRTAGTCAVLEQRTIALAEADARLVTRAADDATTTRTFVGHAAVFDNRTAIGDPLRWGWYEEIASTAFDKTLDEGDARFLVNHDTTLLVARVSAGDLRLATDDIGLAVDSDLDDELSYVRDLIRNLDKRRITGMSFGFYVVRDRWEELEIDVEIDGKTEQRTVWLRIIEEVRLLEVSAVTFPAYEETDAAVRAAEVRAARGVPTDSPAQGDRPAPATATRDDQDDPAPATATRGTSRQDERARALAVRYRLPVRQQP
ncbi:MAG: HK97 family phage prohead protease [Cellulomonas sp.]|uniref:HK97 family phage prohead protease n=1 Tax=Cellulomonas sp. TaxID=40001 RepID=UPI00258E0D0D|nr:HK97 family phage prohead protease [Cellulomonas sp.]MCR6703146.1 HK97 family phage prohead protease [Cellulomonas sp.]